MSTARPSRRQGERYQRQLAIPGWTEEVQQRLAEATVFVAGVGGLGSPLLLYLAAAGVGTLRVCDEGRVQLSNLNRQLLYGTPDVGRFKVHAARRALRRLNPAVRVLPLRRGIDAESLAELVGDASLVVDCLDNFPTRLLLNAHCVRTGTPLLHAGVTALGGQIVLLHPPRTACLACLLGTSPGGPAAANEEAAPGGLEAGGPGAGVGHPAPALPILGAAAGLLGSLQALEALKHLTGLGRTLEGRLLFCDGEGAVFEEVPLRKDPACPVCGKTAPA